jgi:hypothetical protein
MHQAAKRAGAAAPDGTHHARIQAPTRRWSAAFRSSGCGGSWSGTPPPGPSAATPARLAAVVQPLVGDIMALSLARLAANSRAEGEVRQSPGRWTSSPPGRRCDIGLSRWSSVLAFLSGIQLCLRLCLQLMTWRPSAERTRCSARVSAGPSGRRLVSFSPCRRCTSTATSRVRQRDLPTNFASSVCWEDAQRLNRSGRER